MGAAVADTSLLMINWDGVFPGGQADPEALWAWMGTNYSFIFPNFYLKFNM